MHRKELLAIFACASASPVLARHWQNYFIAGCDVMGVDRVDTITLWPETESKAFVGTVAIGRDGYVQGGDLCQRYLEMLRIFLKSNYHALTVIEYDSLFFGPLPKLPCGFSATLAGHRCDGDGFVGQHFYHTPWRCDRETAALICKIGPPMLRAGLNERGFPDRWLGLVVDLYLEPFGIPIWDASSYTYSRNDLSFGDFLGEAKTAVKNGALFVHGVKTAKHFNELTQ